jgi:hypothetical protein
MRGAIPIDSRYIGFFGSSVMALQRSVDVKRFTNFCCEYLGNILIYAARPTISISSA